MKVNLKQIIIGLFIFVIGFTGLLITYLNSIVVNAPDGVVFEVTQGMSKENMLDELKKQSIIKQRWLYAPFVYSHQFTHIKAGEYLFPRGSTPYGIWKQISGGSGYNYRQFLIAPGWTFSQLRKSLNETDGLVHMTSEAPDEVIMTWLGHPEMKPEGQFAPETYYYTKGEQDLVILKRAFNLMQSQLEESWDSRASDLPFKTRYDALIAASIVEKEAFLDSERPVIAGVMVNRLQRHIPLQFDPTVIYGLGDRYDGRIYKKDLKEDTPYNTYIHQGLPPTPISMPGQESISAVMHPVRHEFLYFVARGNGSHQFSSTLSDHHAAVEAAARLKQKTSSTGSAYFNQSLVEGYAQQALQQSSLEMLHDAR